jgi:hypothetical protein
MLVRAEYIRIFDAIDLLYNGEEDEIVVPTGQPGIG